MQSELDIKQWPAEKYKLSLSIRSTGLKAELLPKSGDNCMVIADLEWIKDASKTLQRIEDAVYEEHLPIDVYTTEILIEPDRIFVVPSNLMSDEYAAEEMYTEMYLLEDEQLTEDICHDSCNEVTFIYGLPSGLTGFLERTFCPQIIKSTLAEMYQRLNRLPNDRTGQQMYISIKQNKIDIMAFNAGRLQLANTYTFTEPSDASYFILNSWQVCQFSQLTGYIFLYPGIHDNICDEIHNILSQYINHISKINFQIQHI